MRGRTFGAVRKGGIRRPNLRRAVSHDFPLKAAALAISVLAAVAVAEGAPPPDVTAAFPGRVPVERPAVPQGYVIRGGLGDVGVRLRGPQVLIERVQQQDLRATVDLASVDPTRKDAQDAPVRVSSSAPGVAVVQVDPPSIPVRIEPVVSRTLPVQVRFANEPPSGFKPGPATFSTSDVQVSGAEGLIATVTAVYATLRFGDAPVDLSATAQAVAVDAAGNPVDGAQVDPAAVQVSVPVLPVASTRTVPVLWSLRGAVGAGYWIARVTTDPVAVTVRGDPEALAAIDRVTTAPIDVTGLVADRSFRVSLVLPNGIALLQPTDATVGVSVVPLSGTRPFPLVAVQVLNVPSGLTAETDARTVEVVLAGTVPALAALAADALSAVVDAAGRGPGTYTVDVVIRGAAGFTVSSVQPARLMLTMRQR